MQINQRAEQPVTVRQMLNAGFVPSPQAQARQGGCQCGSPITLQREVTSRPHQAGQGRCQQGPPLPPVTLPIAPQFGPDCQPGLGILPMHKFRVSSK